MRKARIDSKKYFIGSDYILMDYVNKYPDDQPPTEWFIEETLRNKKLQTRKPKTRVKGGSEYLLYPKTSIRNLGYVQQSADFIGKKYIAGQTEPINIFSTCYHAPIKLYQIERVLAEKSVYAISVLEKMWLTYPLPDVFRIDNALQFRGTASGKRALGQFLIFLLNLDIIPLFGSPSKPWTNPNVEGHNRVFNEKVWNQNHFVSLEHIDTECQRFNQESREFFLYRYADLMVNQRELFRTLEKTTIFDSEKLKTVTAKKICFTRFVESYEQKKEAHIVVMNETVLIPEKYTHQFVFAEWLLDSEELFIYSEYQNQRMFVRKLKFSINF